MKNRRRVRIRSGGSVEADLHGSAATSELGAGPILAVAPAGVAVEARRVAVIVPAHDEEELIAACLESIEATARHAESDGCQVRIYVVCDACTDRTVHLAARARVTVLEVCERNVGAARAYGAARAIADGAQWLAFTDADTRVSKSWLVSQLATRSEVVCGTVAVDDWGIYGEAMSAHFARTYDDRDGHRHVHGANLGVCAAAYVRAGGFAPLENEEDVHLVKALTSIGASIAWTAAPRVTTSARVEFRATAGFGATLANVASMARMASSAS